MQNDEGTSPGDLLRKMKLTNTNRIVIGHLNINSIRNKFESVKHIIEENVDIKAVPDEIKNCNSVHSFKSKIKLWIPKACPCRICKKYIVNLGFL